MRGLSHLKQKEGLLSFSAAAVVEAILKASLH